MSQQITRAVIVDDEDSSHTILQYLLTSLPIKVDIVGQAYDVAEGVAVILREQPDIVFLDIEMPDGTGFDLLRQISGQQVHVIFVTGVKENDYAIQAFRFGALDFLLKPIEPDRLAEAVARARSRPSNNVLAEQVEIASEASYAQAQLPSRIAVPTTDAIHFCKVKDIACLEADKNYTTFCFRPPLPSLIASKNLGEYEKQFEPYPSFFRVHKSYIVNLEQVMKYVKGDAVVVLQGNRELPVSKNKREELIERLKKL